MKPLKLYIDSENRIVDESGMEYNLPKRQLGAEKTKGFPCKDLDVGGGVTVTGNLTVQQSDWVYLRGPITGSGAVINGAVTASNLWVRNTTGGEENPMEGMGYLKVDEDIEVRGVSYWEVFDELRSAVRELKDKVESLESRLAESKKNSL